MKTYKVLRLVFLALAVEFSLLLVVSLLLLVHPEIPQQFVTPRAIAVGILAGVFAMMADRLRK